MPIGSRDRVDVRSGPAPSPRRGPSVERPRRADRPSAGPRRKGSAGARKRSRSLLLVIGILVIMLASASAFVVSRLAESVPSCTATIGNETYRIDKEQAANARTVAAVATEVGMPNHAVTIALAAALQESKLHNLSHGDRDSVGLFQQRPSQGWGDPAQLMTPRYAAAAFYRALARVQGWDTMSVTEAAQHVQRSAAPDAYAKWEAEARVLARILTGEVPNRLVCH